MSFYTLWHVYVTNMLHAFVLDGIVWTRKTDTAAVNGAFYGWTTVSVCMSACLRSLSCAAIDFGSIGCVLHNASDLTTTYYAQGVTHFILHRYGQSTSHVASDSPFTSTASDAVSARKS